MLLEPLEGDIDPWKVFLSLYKLPYPVILDSSTGGSNTFAAADPFLVIRSYGNKNIITFTGREDRVSGDPFEVLKSLLKRFKVDAWQLPLQGGCIGYFGYDLKNLIERLPSKAVKTIPTPDLFFAFYDTVCIYNHPKKTAFMASTGYPEDARLLREKRALNRLKGFKRLISKEGQERLHNISTPSIPLKPITSNFSKEDYINAVKKTLAYISAGDCYQINLSQRFSLPLPCHPLTLYESLREENPAPMGGYLRLDGVEILSNSPERFLKIRGRDIETMPIKGTIKRGEDPVKDLKMIERLKNSSKENSEHIMIVDLERNDLGRVCRYGSVRVEECKRIETYPTLHHMVSTVKGTLMDRINPLDAIKACFPGGSITGAPKIRAMEIIDELEPTARGVYTGAIGYIDFSGNCDLNIAIRTAIVHNNILYYQTGGGIVADSDPEREYEETLLKAEALYRALNRACGVERRRYREAIPIK